ncbi:putative extracellular glycosidase [Cladobotryum mycophilum]|uniref:chitinase n=1 Tax=Cladobotryum mycophilum TaxID=491253 RepID=A0ABR0S8A2_9HYPO
MMYARHLLAAASLLGFAAAQVHTDCNPMQDGDCPSDPAFSADHTWNFNSTPSYELWETTAGAVQFDSENYAQFTIAKQGDSPTIRTKFYFFFGRTEIWLKVAPGRGIVSSTMWLSDDLDEVDWEFLGSNDTHASTNYFGKGRQDYLNGGLHPMPGGMQDDFHNYTTVWTKEQIDWFIDGQHVRTLTAVSANNTQNYPQTPMRLSIGIWAGGDPSLPEGTRKWAGGDTDYSQGPYTMHVKSAQVTDFTNGKEYIFGDDSGSWQSIKVVEGNSTALEALNRPPPQPKKSLSQKWAALPSNTKIGIYAGVGGSVGLLLCALLFYCIRQRRIGAKEAKLAAEREQAERLEVEKFKGHHVEDYDTSIRANSMRNNSMLNNSEFNVTEMTGPLDSKGWSAPAAAPALSPTSPRISSPAAGSTGAFDFGIPAGVAPARTPSPGMMRTSSPAIPPNMRSESVPPNAYMRQSTQGPQRLASPGPIQQVRTFSATHAGYRGLPQSGEQ